MKFIKANKLAVLSIAVFVLVAILLALPGQFTHFLPNGDKTFTYNLNGYQTIFNAGKNHLNNALGNSVVGGGIAIVVLVFVSIALICLTNISSFFVLLSAIVNVIIGSLFFAMEGFVSKSYPFPVIDKAFCGWPTYLCGALVMLLALYVGYNAVKMMISEVKHPSAPKGPSYNYLKK